MKCVYLLWTYEEHGPEDLVATLDRSKVRELAEGFDEKGWFARDKKDHKADMAELPAVEYRHPLEILSSLLERSDADLLEEDGHPLMAGWGGLNFQVVELAEGRYPPVDVWLS